MKNDITTLATPVPIEKNVKFNENSRLIGGDNFQQFAFSYLLKGNLKLINQSQSYLICKLRRHIKMQK